MTVYTVLKENQDLSELLTVNGKPTPNTKIVKGMVLSRLDLINLALISSDNLAAITLAENYPGGYTRFVHTMNIHAENLSMHHTRFIEPTGLSPMNYSSIEDVITLTKEVSNYDIVRFAARSSTIVAENVKGKKRVKVNGNSTSKYFGQEGIVTIKTGFTRAAGFCITMLVKSNNQLYNVTVLGARTAHERQLLVEKSLRVIYKA
jgi:D-alanyl-D-alanine endopeptidase (penicillin-binding protein 7)